MIAAWQKKQGAPETGYLTAPQLAALRQQARAGHRQVRRGAEEARGRKRRKRDAEPREPVPDNERYARLDKQIRRTSARPTRKSDAAPFRRPARRPRPPLSARPTAPVRQCRLSRRDTRIVPPTMTGGKGSTSNAYMQISISIQSGRATARILFLGTYAAAAMRGRTSRASSRTAPCSLAGESAPAIVGPMHAVREPCLIEWRSTRRSQHLPASQ